jgi:hypothetical protein
MKSSTGQKIGLPVDRGRHRSPNFVLLGLDLLTSIGLDLLRRHAKSWTASLKEEVGARRAVSKRQMLDTSNSERPNSLLPERAQKEGGKLQRNRSVTQVLALLKNTAKEWNQDKCPQLLRPIVFAAQNPSWGIWPVDPEECARIGFFLALSLEESLSDYLAEPTEVKASSSGARGSAFRHPTRGDFHQNVNPV